MYTVVACLVSKDERGLGSRLQIWSVHSWVNIAHWQIGSIPQVSELLLGWIRLHA